MKENGVKKLLFEINKNKKHFDFLKELKNDDDFLTRIKEKCRKISLKEKKISPIELQKIYERLNPSKEFENNWKLLSKREINEIPNILFYSVGKTPRLINHKKALYSYLEYACEIKKYFAIRRMFILILVKGDSEKIDKYLLLKVVFNALKGSSKKSIEEFCREIERLNLYKKDGLNLLYKEIKEKGMENIDDILKTIRIEKTNFSDNLGKEFIEVVFNQYQRSTVSHDGLKNIMKLLKELECDKSGYPWRITIVESLFKPYEKININCSNSQKIIESYIDKVIGDPRRNPHNWEELEEEKKTYLKWQIDKTFKSFIKIINHITSDQEYTSETWEKRKKIHSKMYEKGLINDAFLILGSSVKKDAEQRFLDDSKLAIGEMSQDSRKAALIMKIQGFTILEYSHEGAMRIWEDVEDAPIIQVDKIYDPQLDLRKKTRRNKIIHDSGGSWIYKFEDFLKDEFGISL